MSDGRPGTPHMSERAGARCVVRRGSTCVVLGAWIVLGPWVVPDAAAQAAPPPVALQLVIPFENATGQPRVYWLSEGSAVLLTDDLIALGASAIRREDRLRAFDRLRRDGKIGAFGVSNFDVADLEEAITISTDIACNQVLYHLKERAIEHVVLPWCEKRGIPVVAYSPLGEGDFRGSDPDLQAVARAHDVAVHAVALAWLARRTFVIPKSSNLAHVRENAAAGELTLSAEEVDRLDRAFPIGPRKPLPMI